MKQILDQNQSNSLRPIRLLLFVLGLGLIGGIAFLAGLNFGLTAHAAEKQPRIVYPKKTELDFDGVQIQGELRNPGEFYFEIREEEKFDSLVKRRKNFHRELLRDAVLSK